MRLDSPFNQIGPLQGEIDDAGRALVALAEPIQPPATQIEACASNADFIPPGGAIQADVSPCARTPLMSQRLAAVRRHLVKGLEREAL